MVCWDEAGKVRGREWSLVEWVAADFRRALTRLSIRAKSEYLLPKEGAKLPAESFALGPAVEEGGKTLQVVEFDTRSTVAGVVHVKVWIETASKLPVRRELKTEDGDTFHESYTSIELDPALGPDAFAQDAQLDPGGSH